MFSPKSAASRANVSRKTIMNAIKSMRLKAHRNNKNYWVIHQADLEDWMRERVKTGQQSFTHTKRRTCTNISPPSPTLNVDFELKFTQQELRHTQEKLENSDKEVARLRKEVQELKDEVHEARKQTMESWSIITRAGLLDRYNVPPKADQKDDLKVKNTTTGPLVLSPEFLVESKNILAKNFDKVSGPSRGKSNFETVLKNAKNLIEEPHRDLIEGTGFEKFNKKNNADFDCDEAIATAKAEHASKELTETQKNHRTQYDKIREILNRNKN